ncbi:MAG: alpha-glucosidase [Clostridiales bacterium]|nr:alpha-glucosidase [Clostridiales bacterium]
MAEKWWQSAVAYQIYPRSFQDSNADGIGDIAGIISRLDYLEKLGIDAIWLSPVCRSPQDDFGYDISDYQDIDPMFGTLNDMDKLVAESKNRGIAIVLDLVLNHTSDEHPWFIEAKKSRDNIYHDYYVWRDGDESAPPNGLLAAFSGSAWEWVPELKQWYLHQFSKKQPDLNWDNPAVRQEIYRMIRWWMDRGVGGFRLDVIDLVGKEPDRLITGNGPKLHDYLHELSKETFQKGDLMVVGETWSASTEDAKIYSNPDGSEFSMVFQFEHIMLDQLPGKDKWDLAPLDFMALKKVFTHWQKELHGVGWNSLFWNNHDLPRIVSRWGNDKEYRVQSAKMLAILLHGLQGTPYIYQGEELGMTNATFSSTEGLRDIESLNMHADRLSKGYSEEEIMKSINAKGRDNARTPMQWDSSENAGFTLGTPWIEVNPNYKEINAASQTDDEDSIFSCYRKLIALRKTNPVFAFGDFAILLEDDPHVFTYKRQYKDQEMLVAVNFFSQEEPFFGRVDTSGMKLALSNYKGESDTLRPYEARLYIANPRGF